MTLQNTNRAKRGMRAIVFASTDACIPCGVLCVPPCTRAIGRRRENRRRRVLWNAGVLAGSISRSAKYLGTPQAYRSSADIHGVPRGTHGTAGEDASVPQDVPPAARRSKPRLFFFRNSRNFDPREKRHGFAEHVPVR